MNKVIESTRTFKAGYQIHQGRWSNDEGESWMPTKWATNLNGDYIGDSRTAYRLCQKRGIAPEIDKGSVCVIGFSKREQKWYGWSHRALYGFKTGDVVEEGDCCTSSGYIDGYLKDHPEIEDTSLTVGFRAKTLDDCKLMAIAFAEAVG